MEVCKCSLLDISSFYSIHKNKDLSWLIFSVVVTLLWWEWTNCKLSHALIVLLSYYMYTMEPEERREKMTVTHRLVFVNGVLDTPTALRDPRGVKHWDRWHSKHWWGQGEVYTGRRDLLVDTRRVSKMENKLEWVWSITMKSSYRVHDVIEHRMNVTVSQFTH